MLLRTGKASLLLVALALVGSACGKGGTITIDGEKANDHGTKTVSGSTFELEADNDGGKFYFDPTVLKGAPGSKVTLEIKNEGSVKHNFTIEDQKVDQDLNPDQMARVTVTFPRSGVVEFHCEYHQKLGMVGALEASS
jgi:plastocyanin